MTEPKEVKKILVVGMNRPRLNKILSQVEERRLSESSASALCEESNLEVDIVPSLAAMGSYEGEDGNPVRYLSNFVSLDGSPLTQFLDDEAFRAQFYSVLLVGYEWHSGDDTQIQNYFKSSNLTPTVEMIQPNQSFINLQAEMDAFKKLDDDQKHRCMQEGNMGPSKMAKFVTDFILNLQQAKISQMRKKAEEDEAKRKEIESARIDKEEPKRIEPADPTRSRYACQKCRTILLGENHLAPDHLQNLHSFRRAGTGMAACQSLFCSEDVLAWLSPSGADIEGRLSCPRCNHKIGHWNWAGAQCSCGTWVTPAIQIPLSKVDIIRPQPASGPGLAGVIRPAVVVPANPR